MVLPEPEEDTMTEATDDSSSLNVLTQSTLTAKAALRASTCLTAVSKSFSGQPCDEPIPEYCEVIGFTQESDGDITFTTRIDLSDLVDSSRIVTDFEPPS